jgi:hypothetical protein
MFGQRLTDAGTGANNNNAFMKRRGHEES